MAIDPVYGYIYICDNFNNVIRRIVNGIITTVVGTGIPGYNGGRS